MSAESVVLVAYGSDPLEVLAALMLEKHRRELPDLSRHVVLFPHPGAISGFRRTLLAATRRAGWGGVLAPWCGTLDNWLQRQPGNPAALIADPERDLLLLEALQPYAALRERYGIWPLVDSLLTLFDELNAYHPAAPPEINTLVDRLAAGYGVPEPLAPLQGEAELVHTLWNAWNTHLHDRRLRDRALQRRAALAAPTAPEDGTRHIYMVGAVDLSGAEAEWLKPLQRAGHATVLLHGGTRGTGEHPDTALRRCYAMLQVAPPSGAEPADPYSRFIEHLHAGEPGIGARARRFAHEVPASPLSDRLYVFAAADFEQEARAVELAVRRWHAQRIHDIAIVAPDRKLARRVRALLERAGLSLRDTAGWALSTTSAATAVMRWIECVEHDFAHAPLLDFLKSPFVTFGLGKPQLEAVVHCFEAEVVRAHNVAGGLDDYRRVVRAAGAKLAGSSAVLDLLERLAAAAEPLRRRVTARARRAVADHLSALQSSIERTGLTSTLSADAAGDQLLAVLRPGRGTPGIRGARLTWGEFHYWLQRELERRRFHPPLPQTGIDLLDLAESRCRRFGALIVAGCTREHLPGAPARSPFFNDGVRATLGLPTRADRLLAPLHDFRRLLEAAPRVLLTWRVLDNGEPALPSPWIDRLLAFHRLAYDTVPDDVELRRLLAAKETALYRHDDSPPPCAAHVPAPRLPPARVPPALSAAAHQRLLDCPYQFYVADGLGLRALDEVRDEMEKSDYGENVHRILQAFHSGVTGLPGPWRGAIEPANRAQAAALLRDLGRHVFGADADRRLTTRGWLFRWESFVDAYIDWQERRARNWQVEATEKTLERTLTIGARSLTLKGRVDRIDRGAAGRAIIDYKTGAIPSQDDMESGEKAQLPFYALLSPDAVSEVLYAKFDKDAVKTKVGMKDGALAALRAALERRLRTLIERIDAGAPLPAWGDPDTCRYCRYEGLCRKQLWSTDAPAAGSAQSKQTGGQLQLFPPPSD